MKKRYTFGCKNWLCFSLVSALSIFSLNVLAQNGPAILWDKVIGGSGDDSPNIIQKTSNGNNIIGGWSRSGVGGDKSQANIGGTLDFWLVLTDAIGNKIWDKTYGGSGTESITRLKQTNDGGFILGGGSNSGISGDKTQPNIGSRDYWIVKIDATGNKQWDKTFGGTSDELFYGVQQTIDGGYLIGGASSSGISGDKTQQSKGSYDYWILKLDASGNKQWDKTFGGSFDEFVDGLHQTSDGGYILFGRSSSGATGDKSQPSNGHVDYWIVKLDANGNKTWDKTLGGNNEEGWLDLKQTSDGGYIIGGTSKSGISGDKTQACQGDMDYWVLKLDPAGNKIWDKTYGGNGLDEMSEIHITTNGDYILGGFSNSGLNNDKSQPSNGGNDYWMVKLNSTGNKIWDKTIGGTQDDFLYSLQVAPDGGYLLAGESSSGISGNKTQASKGMKDFWIVKLAPDVLGIKETETNSIISIYPNPNQGKFNLQLSNLPPSKAEVTISHLLGRVVFQQEFKTANNQLSEEINLPDAKGIYLLQLKTGEQISTRKIIVE